MIEVISSTVFNGLDYIDGLKEAIFAWIDEQEILVEHKIWRDPVYQPFIYVRVKRVLPS